MRIRRISCAAFRYLITHGGGGPFASTAEARLIGAGPPRGAAAIREHAEQVADVGELHHTGGREIPVHRRGRRAGHLPGIMAAEVADWGPACPSPRVMAAR